MPTRAEINFIEMWGELNKIDGCIPEPSLGLFRECKGTGIPEGVIAFSHREEPARCALFALTPRGRDLIETAKVAGIPEVADDEYKRKPWEPAPEVAAPVPCPSCKGTRRVPSLVPEKGRTISELIEGEPAKQAVTLPGWDYACPDCEDGTIPNPCRLGYSEIVDLTEGLRPETVGNELRRSYRCSIDTGRTSSSKPNPSALPRSGNEKMWMWQKLKGKWHACAPACWRAEAGDKILVRRFTGETKYVVLRSFVTSSSTWQTWTFDEVPDLKTGTDALHDKALRLAEKVVQSGIACCVAQARTSWQRKMVHKTLANVEGAYTQSRGEGRHRRLWIMPSEESK